MRFVICSLLALAFAGPAARAQTIMGQVVSLTTRKPLPAVRVALVDDSARVVAVATTDSALGAFYADAPHPGRPTRHTRGAIASCSTRRTEGPS
jgi:hypothetical protein